MQIKTITEELNLIESLGALANAYEQISVMKMQLIRSSVLSTRTFMTDISEVFYHVKSSYRHQIEQLMKKNKKNNQSTTFSTLPTNGREVAVLLSANTKLYGDIINKTFQEFMEATKGKDVDVVIVGLLGKELYEENQGKKNITYFQIPDMNVTLEDLKPLVTFVAQYQTVRVFYGKFQNVVTQVPEATIVTGQASLEQVSGEPVTQDTLRFLFEPSLEKILHFFETQLFSAMVKQTLHEHELARYASRITAMEASLSNIHDKTTILSQRKRQAKKTLENKKQLGALSGMVLWNS